MKQIYTCLSSIFIHFLHFFRGTICTLYHGSFTLLVAAVLVLMMSESFAQKTGKGSATASAEIIAGNWLVADAQIHMLVAVDDTLKLTEKNCFWADHIARGIPVKFDNQGNVIYEVFGKPASARVAIEGDILKFIFVAERALEMGQPAPAENYTDYNFNLNGKQLAIWREDGMVTEKYIFKRQ